ncbi:MAG: bestrophin family protein, partial [Flavobacteriales bacterium]
QLADYIELDVSAFSLLGVMLSIFLVFRTNTAYDRWWEGRKQWGAMVNNTRNFAIKIKAAAPSDSESLNYFKHMLPNYVFAFKEHLRQGVNFEELNNLTPQEEARFGAAEHVPNLIASDLYAKLHSMYRAEEISGDQLLTLDKELKSLTDILGACERIRNTPIPYSYSLFLKKFIFVYTATLPFGLAFDFGWMAVPISTFVLYVFGSIELLAEEIEDPFGLDTNDLPTDELAQKIRNNIAEIIN